LHNDEIIEFPEEEPVDEAHEENKGPAKELMMLVDYLKNSGQTVFDFFKSIDLDDSGSIDGFEFQQAMLNSDVCDFPPWEEDELVAAIDLDSDGNINLPELDIALAKIAAAYGSPEPEEVEDEASNELSKTDLGKLKKAELVSIAKEKGVAATGTKAELVAAILGE
jgi:Ca2+-binding EF-hand superfamily protein